MLFFLYPGLLRKCVIKKKKIKAESFLLVIPMEIILLGVGRKFNFKQVYIVASVFCRVFLSSGP